MFKATDFTYDGIYSAVYGLKIATINGSVVNKTTYIVPTITTAKPAKSKKFYYQDITYSSPPTFEFSVLSEEPIPDLMQREILTWLDSRKGFKPLVIHQPEFEDYTYNCIFTISNIIYHAERCIGFTLKATFDSAYQYGKPTVKTITGTGNVQKVEIFNRSDVSEEYIYPTMTFKSSGYFNTNCNISIINESDDTSREFKFDGVALNAEIAVDNELKIITSDSTSNLLSKFNRKWLRLKKGKNVLSIRVNGTVKITCPNYIKIRF